MAKFVFGQKADKDKKNPFKYLICALHSSDLYFCSYLFFIASIDAYHKDSYVFAKSLWHQTILCHFLSFLFMSSILGCLMSNNLMVTARYMVVHYPMNSVFKRSSPVKKLLLLIFSVAFLVALLFGILENGSHFSDGFCFVLGNLKHSALPMTITVLLSFFRVISSIVQPIAYAMIVAKVKETHFAASLHHDRDDKTLIITACLSSVCNLLCWLSTAFLWSVYFLAPKSDNEKLVTWSLATIVPINTIILPFLMRA